MGWLDDLQYGLGWAMGGSTANNMQPSPLGDWMVTPEQYEKDLATAREQGLGRAMQQGIFSPARSGAFSAGLHGAEVDAPPKDIQVGNSQPAAPKPGSFKPEWAEPFPVEKPWNPEWAGPMQPLPVQSSATMTLSPGFQKAADGRHWQPSQPREQGQGFGQTWNKPAGGGSFSGLNSFSSPDITHRLNMESGQDALGEAKLRQEREIAEIPGRTLIQGQQKPDVYREKLQAAIAVVGPKAQYPSQQAWMRAVLEALNALNGRFDQDALSAFQTPPQP